VRILLRLRPELAPGILAGLVQTNLLEIHHAKADGTFPVLDGLYKAQALRQRGWSNEQIDREPGTVRYEPLDDDEDWKDWERLQKDHHGDCEDLATSVAAELLAARIPAVPLAYQPLPNIWHVITQFTHPKRGRIWIDPSKLGGMTGAA